MIPTIKVLKEKKIIGISQATSISQNSTFILWQNFMPRRNEILNKVDDLLYSIQSYNDSYFINFNPNTEFVKWAGVEVTNCDFVPEKMDCFILPEGLYAVFHYKGLNTDNSIFQYIFSTWLPNSIYQLDNRPHFEVLGEKYKNNDANSEEEIWIPIKTKN